MAVGRAPGHASGRPLAASLSLVLLLAVCVHPTSGRRSYARLALPGRRRPPAFQCLFAFPTGLGLGLTLPDVQPPWLYGKYCGPTPEITVASKCRHPLDLQPIDKADEVCMLHDFSYCNCDRRYYKGGKGAPMSALMAIRSAAPFKEAWLQSLDQQYYKCIHEADQGLLSRYEKLVQEGELPLPSWDPITRFKFYGFLELFRRDMALDQALLALPPQNTLGITWMQSATAGGTEAGAEEVQTMP